MAMIGFGFLFCGDQLQRHVMRLGLFIAIAGPLVGQCAPKPQVKYVAPQLLPPALRFTLHTQGNRTQKPGLERVVSTGVLTRNGTSTPFQLTQELPNLVQLQLSSGSQTLGFDGQNQWSSASAIQAADANLVEMLAYDTVEAFFQLYPQRVPVRRLGRRFRSGGTAAKPAGPFYDIYQSVETTVGQGGARPQIRHYLVNADTLLLGYIQYLSTQPGGPMVQMVVDSWMKVGSNQVPQVFRRLENGSEVAHFTVSSATIGPAVADQTFCAQAAK